MTDMPSEAAIRELIRRVGYGDSSDIIFQSILEAPDSWKWAIFAAQMLEKYEPEILVDPVVLRAREIVRDVVGFSYCDDDLTTVAVIRALREGMGE